MGASGGYLQAMLVPASKVNEQNDLDPALLGAFRSMGVGLETIVHDVRASLTFADRVADRLGGLCLPLEVLIKRLLDLDAWGVIETR